MSGRAHEQLTAWRRRTGPETGCRSASSGRGRPNRSIGRRCSLEPSRAARSDSHSPTTCRRQKANLALGKFVSLDRELVSARERLVSRPLVALARTCQPEPLVAAESGPLVDCVLAKLAKKSRLTLAECLLAAGLILSTYTTTCCCCCGCHRCGRPVVAAAAAPVVNGPLGLGAEQRGQLLN